jgi:uncharacterized membrane protein
MYKIIGADQKEYGPISTEQIRQWIAEGRVNAQTQACAEGTQDWRPLGMFPDFAFTTTPAAEEIPGVETAAPVSSADILNQDYSLDIGDCVSKSWELVKANFWPVVGITFLVMVAMNVINQLLGLISRPALNGMINNHQVTPQAVALVLGTSILATPISSVLMGGLFRYYLKLIRRQEATVADAFSGFSDGFAQLALLGLAQGVLVWLGIILCVIPGIYLATAWYFSTLLVADKGLDFWSAMELSRKVVSKHWFVVFGFLLVMALLAAAGVIACCIGVLVSAPVAFVAMTHAYETIFNRKTA